MNFAYLLGTENFPAGRLLWTPGAFAGLLGLAVVLVAVAFAPASPARAVSQRLDSFVDRGLSIDDLDLSRPFASRVGRPLLLGVLRFLSRFAPKRNADRIRKMLLMAGEPGRLGVADFFGLRIMSALICGGVALLLVMLSAGLGQALFLAIIVALVGYLLPQFWLGSRVRGRQKRIRRALPNALDMLTVGVEAGLAFESAMLRVGEKIQGPLSREFRRTVGEMRVGTARDVALQRMAERIGLDDLDTFVAVLIQSTQLGVPIGRVLHEQAAEIRLKRRQRVEELARQAGVKMVLPLTFFILPALFIVALGPAVPRIMAVLGALTVSAPPPP